LTLSSGQGAEVLCSIKTKVHAIGLGVAAGLLKAIELAESRYRGLVVWSPDEPFSVGADLQADAAAVHVGWRESLGARRK